MAEKSNPSARERDRQTTQSGTSEKPEVSSAESANSPAAESVEPDNARTRGSASAAPSDTSRPSRNPTEHVRLKSIGSLERLRDRVDNAAHELKRLREENQALSERIRELEARPNVDPQGTFLSLEHDPELLRRKINGFIEAIDRYLESERKRS